jgi:hypothetical protein
MALSRRRLLVGVAFGLIAPALLRGDNPATAGGQTRTISARIRLPSGRWKRFSGSVPNGGSVGRGTALAWVCDRNGVDPSKVADLAIA